MAKIQRLTAAQRDDLVAYLDGELEEPVAAEIERTLAESNIARNEVEMLSRTWDLLDLLPRQSVTADFTRKTMTLALESNKAPLPISQRPWFKPVRRGIVAVAWCVVLVGLAGIGYSFTRYRLPNESHLLLDNLTVIEQLEDLRELHSEEFLKTLASQNVLPPEPGEDEAAKDDADSKSSDATKTD